MQQRVGQVMLRGAVVACGHLQDPAYQAEPLNLLIDLLLLASPASKLASQVVFPFPVSCICAGPLWKPAQPPGARSCSMTLIRVIPCWPIACASCLSLPPS